MTFREALQAAADASHQTHGNKIACVVLDHQHEAYDWVWDETWLHPTEEFKRIWVPIERVWCPGAALILLGVPPAEYQR
jgi:hypothetical protein